MVLVYLINFLLKKNSKTLNFVFFSKLHSSKNLISLLKIWTSDDFFKNFIYICMVRLWIKNTILKLKI